MGCIFFIDFFLFEYEFCTKLEFFFKNYTILLVFNEIKNQCDKINITQNSYNFKCYI